MRFCVEFSDDLMLNLSRGGGWHVALLIWEKYCITEKYDVTATVTLFWHVIKKNVSELFSYFWWFGRYLTDFIFRYRWESNALKTDIDMPSLRWYEVSKRSLELNPGCWNRKFSSNTQIQLLGCWNRFKTRSRQYFL